MRKTSESDPVLSIIIPVLNEEQTIGIVLDRIKRTLKDLSEDFEIIVVDDGSTDTTWEIAQMHARQISGARIIRNISTTGYGSALKAGLFQAKGKYLAFLDADNTYPPEEIPYMLKQAKKGSLVVSSRFSLSRNGMSFVRKLGNLIFAATVTILTGKAITDVGSGLRVFDRSLLRIVTDLPNDLSFTPAMTVKSVLYGFSYTEVRIAYGQREGKSKLNLLRDGWAFFKTIILTFSASRNAHAGAPRPIWSENE
jgi:glycosyltransferase involved in cell wall biosynthesis